MKNILGSSSKMVSCFDKWKNEGNDYFGKEEYDKAVECYSKALSSEPHNHLALGNRSAAYIKLGKYEEAYQDAAKCVSISPKFARGYLRKASALNGMEKFSEAKASAEEGYRLRGSDRICKDCVSEWLTASNATLRKEAEKLESIPGVYPVTDECLRVFSRIEQQSSSTGVSVQILNDHMTVLADELEAILQKFGHALSPCMRLWTAALFHSLKLNPRTHSPPTEQMNKRLGELVLWLKNDVDHLLYPLIRPVFGLLTLCMLTCVSTLSQTVSSRSLIQVLTNACLVFFKDSLLSIPLYLRLRIDALQKLLNSYCMETGQNISKEKQAQEEVEIRNHVHELKRLLDQYDSSNADHSEVKKVSKLIIENVMLLISPNDAHQLCKKLTKDDNVVLKDLVAREIDSLIVDDQLRFRDMDTLVLATGGLVHLNEIECAKMALKRAEQFYLSVIIQLLQNKLAVSLDDTAESFFHPQTMMLCNALFFAGVDDTVLANILITWKSLATELYALFARLGINDSLLNVFKKIESFKASGKGTDEESLVMISEQHHQDVGEVVHKWSKKIIDGLFDQSWEKIQLKLAPNQMLLQYCMCPTYDTKCFPVPIPPKVVSLTGILMAIKSSGNPIIQIVDFDKIQKLALESHEKAIKAVATKEKGGDWRDLQIEADKIGSSLLQAMLPMDLQAIISNNEIESVYFCPDQVLSKFPIEILPFNDGKRFGEKVAITYLSSAREILRESTFSAICQNPAGIKKPSSKCVIFANPNFDLVKSEPEASSHWNSLGSLFSSFFNPTNKTEIKKATPLPASEEEAHDIEYLLASTKIGKEPCQIDKYIRDDATLHNVFQIQSPLVLHLATHGFSSPDFHYQYRNFWSDTRTGLLLAGANTYRLQNYNGIVREAGTGELTALAACGINLDGTRLVYLSSCRSSYGFIGRGDSLSNLAQGFRMAGSQTIIATLWPISDEIGRKMALHFYFFVKEGMRPSLALKAAKLKLREEDSYDFWYDWAGFLCVGLDNPVFV